MADLRREMMDDLSRKRRRLDREKRALDAPRPREFLSISRLIECSSDARIRFQLGGTMSSKLNWFAIPNVYRAEILAACIRKGNVRQKHLRVRRDNYGGAVMQKIAYKSETMLHSRTSAARRRKHG